MVSFWEIDVWSFVVMLGVIFAAMLFANFLRRVIRPLRRSMIPAAVLGGFLCLFLGWAWKKITGHGLFDEMTLEALTYHGLGLGVVAMTFRRTAPHKDKKGSRDVFNSGVLTVSTYLLQAILGLGITLGLSYVIHNWAAAGILLPMGFGQGPGNAYGWGLTYQTATDYPAFTDGASFGLTVAAMGFIAASVGGVIYLQMIRKKSKRVAADVDSAEMEELSLEVFTDKGEIPITDSLDKLTIQFGLVFLAYLLAYIFNRLVSIPLDKAGGFLQGTVKPLLWNFNFLVGMLFTAVIKGLLNLGKKTGVIHREYINNFMMNRISGFLFDVMVVASIAAIDLKALTKREFIFPLLTICIVGGVATFFFVRFVCRKLFSEYADEEFLIFYGMLTGTNCTGFILLREIDPYYKTPAAKNLIFQNLWAVIFGAPMLLLMGVAANSLRMTWITWGILVGFFLVMIFILFRSVIFRRKKAPAEAVTEE